MSVSVCCAVSIGGDEGKRQVACIEGITKKPYKPTIEYTYQVLLEDGDKPREILIFHDTAGLAEAHGGPAELKKAYLQVAVHLADRHIHHTETDCGDHVVVTNCRDVAMHGFDWKHTVFQFDKIAPVQPIVRRSDQYTAVERAAFPRLVQHRPDYLVDWERPLSNPGRRQGERPPPTKAEAAKALAGGKPAGKKK